MRRFFRAFLDRYFHDEEAIIFTLILISALLVLLTIGSFIAPLIAALIIAYLLQGMVNTLLRLNVSYLLAVVLVYTLFISGFMALLLWILPQAWSQLARLINELPRLIGEGQNLLMLLPENYPDLMTQQQVQDIIRTLRGELAMFGQYVLSYSISSLPNIFSWIMFLILVPVLVFFMMKDKTTLVHWVANLLPRHRPLMRKIWQEMDVQVANYVRGKSLEILIVGGTSYLAFTILGMNYTLLLAVLMGLSVIVPFIGVAVVVFPVMAVAYVQWGLGSEFFTVLAVYTVIQLLDANVLVPIIFSETVNLHPVAIIAAVLVFGGLWGLAGVFFAIPLATLIKAIVNTWPTHAPPDDEAVGPDHEAARIIHND
ncbi:AI-2E family transporter [Pseudohongiella sp. SYSU M77423]|uniref:AI-2E family transporter n=1 Tax=unclassified Pseudohongiella TaxID=2629611 RepID=UPI000E9CE121|nr:MULTISPECIES: AI-2E family transporter [unclassified Pseudohongiella]MDH7944919.1 AI-2E family transporter [Pseudohongiella sp. SYSU M77423]HBX36814.1 AI-2E family transporter [Pseudohongiella sp.]|tara:strand:- start:4080 stop:5189 length:1110 start_codon:yes stop_codon:yes gene_type:complete